MAAACASSCLRETGEPMIVLPGAVAAGMTCTMEGAGLERKRDQGDREKEGGGHRYRLGSFRGSPPLEPCGPPCLCYPV